MKYKITVNRYYKNTDLDPKCLINEYIVKAKSEMSAILKTLRAFKIKLQYRFIEITWQNNFEFIADFDNKQAYGIIINDDLTIPIAYNYEVYCEICHFVRTINMLKDNAKKLRKEHRDLGHIAHYRKMQNNPIDNLSFYGDLAK